MAPDAKYNEKLEVVTKEVTICKLLTSNDLKIRKRGISCLKKWFREIGQKKIIDETDYDRIWNGLFYYVWMSDKPLVQEETAESISGMIHLIENYENSIYFIRGFFHSLVRQWDRISHYRIDKFLMFVRRFLRQILILLKNHEWSLDKVESFSGELYTAIQILPYSVALHLNEIFNEELAKVSRGKIPTEALVRLLKGFAECIANLKPSMQIVNNINTNIFGGLVRQLKLYIKQKAVADDCDSEDIEENEESGEGDDTALDPRPGGVNVYLPYIEFDENVIVTFFKSYLSKPGTPVKAKNIFNQIIDMFTSISRLRASMSDPERLLKETIQENPKKRKNKIENLSSLIKKSCKRLEEEEDEYDDRQEDKILKKLRTMSDIIQIPAGKSTFTVFKTNESKSEEPTKRSSLSNDWTVSEVEKRENTPTKLRTSGNKEDWVVEEVLPETVENETISADTTVPECGSIIDESFRLEISMLDDVADKAEEKQTANETSVRVEEPVVTSTEVEKKQSRKSTSVSFVEEPQVVSYENDSDSKTEAESLDVVESVIVVPSSIVDGKSKLLKEDTDYVVVNFASENNKESEAELDTKRDSEEDSNRITETNKITESDEIATEVKDAKWQTVPFDIVLELTSKCDDTLKQYDDSSEEKPARKLRAKKTETKAIETTTRVLRTKKIEVQPEPSTPSKRTRSQTVEEVDSSTESVDSIEPKRGKRLRDKTGESVVGRKSLRIAERQKKVHFKLDENSSQDVSAYQKSVKFKPEVPFRGSIIPPKSILKPSAVSSPINPFYFPNGERKLKKKRK